MKVQHQALMPAIVLTLTAFGAALSACATSPSETKVLRSNTEMTIYTYDRDVAGSNTSACTGSCTEVWTPVPIEDASGRAYGSISREDGTQQLTYEGKPVYYYVKDQKPGDMYGDGIDGVWHVISKRANRTKRRARGYPSGYD